MTDETDEKDEKDEELTVAEAMAFGEERIETETEGFEGEIPKHSGKLLAHNATTLLQTLTQIDIQRANDEIPEPTDEFIEAEIADDLVDILLGVAAVKHEYDIDVAAAFEEHIEFVTDYRAMEDAMQDAETKEEMAEAFEEHMGEHAEENPLEQAAGDMEIGGIEPGDNVDDDDYDADDDRDRHIA